MSNASAAIPAGGRSTAAAHGRSLLLVSALAFSTAGFFTREIQAAVWATVFWRNLFGSAGLLLVLAIGGRGSTTPAARFGRRGWAVVACSSLGTIFYIGAFARTTVAHVSIIYATAPLITAALAWAVLREPLSRRTLVCALVAAAGVLVTVGGSVGSGTAAGDGLALLMTLAMSALAVLTRGGGPPALPAALVASLVPVLAAVPLGWAAGSGFAVTARDAMWLAGFGFVTMTLALPCYLWGAARVPAAKSMLISALEMPLAPLWVWLAFGEAPGRAALLGGVAVAGAVLVDLRRDGQPPKFRAAATPDTCETPTR